MTTTELLDPTPIESCFSEWRSEQAEFESQVAESLAALDAYQSHLDNWQQALAAERAALEEQRARLESESASGERAQQEIEALRAELNDTRNKVATLTTDLVQRSDELRQIDRQRSELATELEVARSRERELTRSLEEQHKHLEQQEKRWNEEFQTLRALLERANRNDTDRPADNPQLSASPAAASGTRPAASTNPLLGSVVAQFDKLRQQQARGRQAIKKKS